MVHERSGRVANDTVEKIRTAIDIVDLIGEYVSLKRSGKNFKGLCPFHSEKTPSFQVGPDKQMFYCFGCQKGGDLFTFLMEHDGVSFVDALRQLGQKAGIVVEMDSHPGSDDRDRYYHAAEKVAQFFVKNLWEGSDGPRVREYLQGRGVSREIAERFRLGMANDSWDDLAGFAGQEGFDLDVLQRLGLIGARQSGGHYDLFRNRLIFPITSLSGRVIGFGGRALPGPQEKEAPKYVNSSDSPIYHKNHLLYGLTDARGAIRRQDSSIITEGYMDYLSLFQAGIQNVVAACGTAFGEHQAALLHRYTHRAYILGDSDVAGRRSAVRSAGLLLEHGFLVHIVELPSGHDPDSFVREYDAEALETRIREAPGYIAYMKLLVDRRAGDISVKERVIRHLLEDLRGMSDPLLRELYTKEICRSFTLSEDIVAAALQEKPKRSTAKLEPSRPTVSDKRTPEAVLQARRGLLSLALTEKAWTERILSELTVEDFGSDQERMLFEAIRESHPDGLWRDFVSLKEANDFGSELEIGGPPRGRPDRLFQDYCARLIEARIVAAKAELELRIQEAENRNDPELLKRLAEERQALARQRQDLRRPPSF